MKPEKYIADYIHANGITLASVAERADIKYQRLRYALIEGELTASEYVRVCDVLGITDKTVTDQNLQHALIDSGLTACEYTRICDAIGIAAGTAVEAVS